MNFEDHVNSYFDRAAALTGHPQDLLRRQPALRDLRTAAFFTAINKVARAYLELGVFP